MEDNRELARNTDPDTSKEAAAAVSASARATMCANLLAVYRDNGPMIAERAAELAGYTPKDGAWKRVSDLLNAGLLVDTGERVTASSGRKQRVLTVTSLAAAA